MGNVHKMRDVNKMGNVNKFGQLTDKLFQVSVFTGFLGGCFGGLDGIRVGYEIGRRKGILVKTFHVTSGAMAGCLLGSVVGVVAPTILLVGIPLTGVVFIGDQIIEICS